MEDVKMEIIENDSSSAYGALSEWCRRVFDNIPDDAPALHSLAKMRLNLEFPENAADYKAMLFNSEERVEIASRGMEMLRFLLRSLDSLAYPYDAGENRVMF